MAIFNFYCLNIIDEEGEHQKWNMKIKNNHLSSVVHRNKI